MIPLGIGESEALDIVVDSAVAVEVDILRARSCTVDAGDIEEDDGCLTRNTHRRISVDTVCGEIGIVFGDAAELAA